MMTDSEYTGVNQAIQGITDLASSVLSYNATKHSLNSSIRALKKERDYNIKNFRQGMADTLAANKMSFYASGLEQEGTALNITTSNQIALGEDLKYMEDVYKQELHQLNVQKKANKRALIGNVVGSVAGTAIGAAMAF